MESNTAYWIDKIYMMYIPGKGPMPKRIAVYSNCKSVSYMGQTGYCANCGKRMEGYVDERPTEYRKGRKFV